MIAPLQAERNGTTKQIEMPQATDPDAVFHSMRCEALVGKYQERFADLQQKIDNLAADNAVRERCWFGPWR